MLHSSHKQKQVASVFGGVVQHLRSSAGSRLSISPARWRWEQGETFALPVVLSADSSHQSLPWALRDDELEWTTYLSWLGFNEVSVPPSLIGNYLVHQEFWQLSKSHSAGTRSVANLKFASHLFIQFTVWKKNKWSWLDSALLILEKRVCVSMGLI